MTNPLFEQIQLRAWRDSDFDAAVTLNREAEEHIGIGSETGDWATDMEGVSETFEGSGGELLVGELDEKMVVMGGFKRLSDTTAEVKRMRVSPELQGQGIGPQLLAALENKMRERGVKNSVVSTLSVQEAALKLYTRAGYTETGREELTEGPEKGFTVVSFEKDLAPKAEVQLATLDELEELTSCLQPIYADTYPNDRGIRRDMFENDTFRSHLKDYLLERISNPDVKVWIARIGDKVVGTIGLQALSDEEAEIWGFYVDTDQQGSGVGSQLWNTLMQSENVISTKKLSLDVAKDSKKAYDYYKKRGFEVVGEREWNWPSWTDEHLVNQYWEMERILK